MDSAGLILQELVKVRESQAEILQRVAVVETVVSKVNDHEERVRVLETARTYAVGVVTTISSIVTFVLTSVVAIIVHVWAHK